MCFLDGIRAYYLAKKADREKLDIKIAIGSCPPELHVNYGICPTCGGDCRKQMVFYIIENIDGKLARSIQKYSDTDCIREQEVDFIHKYGLDVEKW